MEIKDPKLAEQVAAWTAEHKRASAGLQRRYLEAEMRLDFDQKAPKMVGYAAVFNQRAEIWPGFWEQIEPGAFTKTIQNDDVRALWNHDANYVLGRTKSQTLTLSEDERGLKYEIIPPDTTWARDLMTLIKRRDVSQSSFGFNIVERRVKNDKESHETTVTLTEVKLFDVSPVTFPAYSKTEVHVRMIEGEQETAYLFEDSGQVIVVPGDGPEPRSDFDFFKELESLQKRVNPAR